MECNQEGKTKGPHISLGWRFTDHHFVFAVSVFYASSVQDTIPRWQLIWQHIWSGPLSCVPEQFKLSLSSPHPGPVPPVCSLKTMFPKGDCHLLTQASHKTAKYKPCGQRVSPSSYLLLCLAYYPPRSNSRGDSQIMHAGQDRWGVCV